MKRIVRLLGIGLFFLSLCGTAAPRPAAAESPVQVKVDGKTIAFDVPPRLESGRVLVPLRAIADALDLTVGWDGATSTITLTGDGTLITLVVGDSTARANARAISLDVPAQVVDGRTLVPARFISEATGAQVSWDGASRTVMITAAAPAGWKTFDSGGLTLRHPPGWTVETGDGGMVGLVGTQGETLVIWPFFVQTALETGSAGALLKRMAGEIWPGVPMEAPESAGSGAVVAHAGQDGHVGTALVAWVNSPKGAAGYAYFAAAPDAVYRQSAATFGSVLQSIHLSGAPESAGGAESSASAPALSFVQVRDPKEGAFSVEIPKGWTVQGGTVRPSLLLVQVDYTATSPDGEIRLWMGDYFPLYVEPSWILTAAGFGPGSTYVDDGGYRWRIDAYAPGKDFVTRHFLPERTGQVQITGATDLPALAAELATVGVNTFDAGRVQYRTIRSGKTYVGDAVAVTERIEVAGQVNWHLWRMFLYEAPEGRLAEAEAALQRMAESFAIDPQWAEMQAKLTAAQSKIITDMGHSISETINGMYQTRAASEDELSRRRSNATLGVTDVVDPATGRGLQVESSADYYWVNQNGQVVGTQTYTSPGLDFRALVQLP
ncbi:MAG TPA: copper amine oxidase N-terminal domain-containing protein [Symbiobacteriaceae bacterium]|nr:copper amine oxidase N-terminal domain-containing protein [Symbiobacteriaceae bacterium]